MFKRKIPFVAISVSILGLLYFGAFFWTSVSIQPTNSVDVINHTNDTAFGDLFSDEPYIEPSTPYSVYKKIADSIAAAKHGREYDQNAVAHWGVHFGNIGIQKTKWFRDIFKPEADSQFNYYFSIRGYQLDDNARYFIKNDRYYLAYVVWDTVKYTNGDSVRNGHYERKVIPVRYAENNRSLLLPLSKKQFNILSIVVYVLSAARLAALVIFFLGLPAQILTNISRGKPFERKNILYLRIMTIYLVVDMLLSIAGPYILSLFLGGLIPSEFSREPFFSGILGHIFYLIGVVALFIIGKAFQRGYKLQQEQDLTI